MEFGALAQLARATLQQCSGGSRFKSSVPHNGRDCGSAASLGSSPSTPTNLGRSMVRRASRQERCSGRAERGGSGCT